VVIGQTIALDIQGNWWRNWWRRRRGYAAYATEFYAMIEAETDPIVTDLKTTQARRGPRRDARHPRGLPRRSAAGTSGLCRPQGGGGAGDVLLLSAHDQRRCTVKDTLAALRSYAA
jgi:hypothetical protein